MELGKVKSKEIVAMQMGLARDLTSAFRDSQEETVATLKKAIKEEKTVEELIQDLTQGI